MKTGKLRKRLEIQYPTYVDNDYGEPTIIWKHFLHSWASVEPLSGNERWIGDQFFATVELVFRMRYRPGVTPKMRIRYNDRLFDIQVVRDVTEFGRELIIGAREDVPERATV